MYSTYWTRIHQRAKKEFLASQHTSRLWADPLSIYSYNSDPTKLAVVMFNASLRERRRDVHEFIAEIKAKIQEYSCVVSGSF